MFTYLLKHGRRWLTFLRFWFCNIGNFARPGMTGISLPAVLRNFAAIPRVRRQELQFADRVRVWTQNSEYDLLVLGPNEYLVTGGWFDRERLSPLRVHINGCTWGGSMIVTDTVAAPGMCIEFSNRVITSPIRRVVVCRPLASQQRH